MKIPVRVSYTHDSQAFGYNFDLIKDDHFDKIESILIWAANKGVVVTIAPLIPATESKVKESA